MTTTQVAAPRWRALGTPRAAAWVHYASLVVGAAVLFYLARHQWFYFDEWDIIWQPEAARRFTEGHNGHWSAVPIALWTLLQNTVGLGSYLPFLAVAIVVHLATAHLLWRLLIRIGVGSWIATALIAVFVLYGAASENLLWAFQMGFMGAIACGIGALLLAFRPAIGAPTLVGIVALLTVGAATAGTVLPFFLAVAIVLWYRHGWRSALIAVGPPSLIYLFWYAFIAGTNPTAAYRADSVGELLAGVPQFVATMFVGTFDASTPIPGFGIIVVTAIALWGVFVVASRRLTPPPVLAISLLAAGLAFGMLTGYSRMKLGAGSADESRYIYVVAVCTLPTIGLMLSQVVKGVVARSAVIIALIAVVFSFNVGTLFLHAETESTRELGTRDSLSAALDLADEYPGAVDPDALPDPVYLPRTVSELQVLENDFGLRRSAYGEDARLTALTSVGILAKQVRASTDATCTQPVEPGATVEITPAGVDFDAADGGSVTAHAQEGSVRGQSRTIELDPGRTELTALEPVTLVIEQVTAPVTSCEGAG